MGGVDERRSLLPIVVLLVVLVAGGVFAWVTVRTNETQMSFGSESEHDPDVEKLCSLTVGTDANRALEREPDWQTTIDNEGSSLSSVFWASATDAAPDEVHADAVLVLEGLEQAGQGHEVDDHVLAAADRVDAFIEQECPKYRTEIDVEPPPGVPE